MSCTECGKTEGKYKCPKCYSKYCSVACCKSHKAKECEPVKRAAEEVSKTPSAHEEISPKAAEWSSLTESGDHVPEEKLAQLGNNEELKDLLHNPHLRAIMENLVNSEDPSADLQAAMQEPIFVELADQCLKVVEGDPK